jgi:hypothetical protein
MKTRAVGTELFLMRVGDSERDACMAELTEHHLQGRLSVEEFDRRQRAALVAVTAADLQALVADLPSSGEYDARAVTPARAWLRSGRARAIAAWAGAPVAIITSSTLFATYDYNGLSGPAATFWGSAVTGLVGFTAYGLAARLKRRQ